MDEIIRLDVIAKTQYRSEQESKLDELQWPAHLPEYVIKQYILSAFQMDCELVSRSLYPVMDSIGHTITHTYMMMDTVFDLYFFGEGDTLELTLSECFIPDDFFQPSPDDHRYFSMSGHTFPMPSKGPCFDIQRLGSGFVSYHNHMRRIPANPDHVYRKRFLFRVSEICHIELMKPPLE
jgi:hypothetical protein